MVDADVATADVELAMVEEDLDLVAEEDIDGDISPGEGGN